MQNVQLNTRSLSVKTAYEANPNTNAFTDAEKSKLSGIQSGAQINAVFTVNGYVGTVVLNKTDIGLANVENTALSSWAGSTALTTVGTITSGTWNGTNIALNKIAPVTVDRAIISNGSGNFAASSVTATEIGYVGGVISPIQTQLNTITSTIGGMVTSVNNRTGAVTLTKADVGLDDVENTALSTWAGSTSITTLGTIASGTWNGSNIAINKIAPITVSRAVVSDGSGNLSAATTTATEIGYLNGVTSGIQTQFTGKVSSSIAGITGADQITNMVSLTQAEYNAITPNAATLYVITDA